MNQSDDCASGLHDYCGPCECPCHDLTIDKPTALELIDFLKDQYINHEYTRIHELFLRLWKFVESDVNN